MTLLLARAREVLSLSETIITFTAESFGHDALYSQADLMVSTVHAAANKLLVAFMGKEAVDHRRATFQTKVEEQLVAYRVMDYPSEICALMQAEKYKPPFSQCRSQLGKLYHELDYIGTALARVMQKYTLSCEYSSRRVLDDVILGTVGLAKLQSKEVPELTLKVLDMHLKLRSVAALMYSPDQEHAEYFRGARHTHASFKKKHLLARGEGQIRMSSRRRAYTTHYFPGEYMTRKQGWC